MLEQNQNDDRIFLEQVSDICHKVSPLRLSSTIKKINTTTLIISYETIIWHPLTSV